MLVRPTVREVPNDTAGVYAFHILGEVTAEDMSAMAEHMNERFDRHDKVSMLLIFDAFRGAEKGANTDWGVIKSRLRALSKVDKYAVVNAPERAERMIEAMNAVIPVEARTFDSADAAWAFVGALPEDAHLHR